MALRLSLLILLGLVVVGQSPPGPTDGEKLALNQMVKQYLQQQQIIVNAQIKASTLVQEITAKREEVEKKYNCTYNLDTDVCAPKEKN